MLIIFGSSIYPAISPFAHNVANATYLPLFKDIFREILIVLFNPDFLPHCSYFPIAIYIGFALCVTPLHSSTQNVIVDKV